MKKHCLILLLSFISLTAQAQQSQFYIEDQINNISVRIYVVDDKTAQTRVQQALYQSLDHAKATLNKIDAGASQGELWLINQKGTKGIYPLSNELSAALEQGIKVSHLTSGAFDITVNSKRGNYNRASINKRKNELKIKEDGITLNIPNFRGVLADQIIEDLRAIGFHNCLAKVDDIFASRGTDSTGPWKIPALTPTEKLATKVLFFKAKGDVGAATFPSRVFAINVIDPRTKQAVVTDLKSASIFIRGGAEAEAVSQALYVMGTDEAKKFLAQHKRYRAILNPASGNLLHIPTPETGENPIPPTSN